jgi:response regulator RpfG family c-di-GMP phosphodiesterase
MTRSNLAFLKKSAPPETDPRPQKRWKLIIADDEPHVHDVTRFALADFTFEQRSLEFIHAYSGAEAYEAAMEHPDAAVMLVDVVMEHEHAGLDLIRRLRDELGNQTLRLVLRTGQPGVAPEREVIRRYDINDYKDKTELSSAKLETLMFSCLRSYRDIKMLEASKRGLEKVIDASAELFTLRSVELLTAGVLDQISSLLAADEGSLYARLEGVAATYQAGEMRVLAATGPYVEHIGEPLRDVLPEEARGAIDRCLKESIAAYSENGQYIGVFKSEGGDHKVIYLNGYYPRSAIDQHLLTVFSRNVGISFENVRLQDIIEQTQREFVYRLGGAVESRSKETANHVKRVAHISELIGLTWGMSEREAEIFLQASPMHDVGKIGIPDAILNKPAKLTPEEWEVMKTHTLIGHDLLKESGLSVLQAGAMVALEHHEKWDGQAIPTARRAKRSGSWAASRLWSTCSTHWAASAATKSPGRLRKWSRRSRTAAATISIRLSSR